MALPEGSPAWTALEAHHRTVAGLAMGALFEAVAGGDSFPVRKPDPGHVLGLLDAMGAAPAAVTVLRRPQSRSTQ